MLNQNIDRFPSAFPYQSSSSTFNPPSSIAINKSESLKHFMPLNNGASPQDGPSPSIFSSPKPPPSFVYSPQTKQVLSDLMKESRLTMSQQSGFQSILRRGESLPPRPSPQMMFYKTETAKARHAARARSLGIRVGPPPPFPEHNVPHRAQMYYKFGPGGRRTFQQIQTEKKMASLEASASGPRRYIGVDKEREKDRLAHRMATGKDPEPIGPLHIKRLMQKQEEAELDRDFDSLDSRFMELIGEIEDRLDFMEQTNLLGRSKEYQRTLQGQIRDLLGQMRSISREKTDLALDWLGPRLEVLMSNKKDKQTGYRPSQVGELLNQE